MKRSGSGPKTGSWAASGVSSTSNQPISGSVTRLTVPPATSAISWLPRQTPKVGTSASRSSPIASFSGRSQGCVSSSCEFIEPPKIMAASYSATGCEGGCSSRVVHLVELVARVSHRLAEDAGLGVRPVDDGENPHRA